METIPYLLLIAFACNAKCFTITITFFYFSELAWNSKETYLRQRRWRISLNFYFRLGIVSKFWFKHSLFLDGGRYHIENSTLISPSVFYIITVSVMKELSAFKTYSNIKHIQISSTSENHRFFDNFRGEWKLINSLKCA